MRLLLDTHAYLWWESGSPYLSGTAREAISDPHNEVCVSIVTLWEIAVKVRIGKLDADLAQLMEGMGENGFRPLGVQPEHVLETVRLPLHHKDPFDRLLIATARIEGLTLISDDERLPLYPVDLLPCSDR